jgi:hypothetical protein
MRRQRPHQLRRNASVGTGMTGNYRKRRERREKGEKKEGEKSEKTHLILPRLKLPPHRRIPQRNRQRLLRHIPGVSNHRCPPLQQGAVGELSEGRFVDFALSGDLGVLHEHVGAGDTDVGELTVDEGKVSNKYRRKKRRKEGKGKKEGKGETVESEDSHPAVVDTVATHLLTDVADADTRKESVRLRVPQRHDESLRPIAHPLDDQLREDGAVSR